MRLRKNGNKTNNHAGKGKGLTKEGYRVSKEGDREKASRLGEGMGGCWSSSREKKGLHEQHILS